VPDYSALDRVLHRLALASAARAEMLHDIERTMFLSSAPPLEGQRHVIVTGLARAGTTILMRELHRTGAFGSLTYADMPFVLAPNLWSRVARGRRSGEARERAHGDGILVTTESPEALDEVWWRLLSGIDYIRPEGLAPHDPGPETIAGYRDLVRLVLRRTGRARYLSKNNNMVLRLPALADAWPEARFLVPVRNPLQQAASLLDQHRRFAKAEPFTHDYMTWLSHHEFGATHRPFLFEGRPSGDPTTLDYWLGIWTATYRHVGRAIEGRTNVLLVVHEMLRRDPGTWSALLDRLDLPPARLAEVRDAPDRDVPAHDAGRAREALALYEALASRAVDATPIGGAIETRPSRP
jgi:hypothetical protein